MFGAVRAGGNHLRYLVYVIAAYSVITVMISTHCTMDVLSKNNFPGDSAVTIVTYSYQTLLSQ